MLTALLASTVFVLGDPQWKPAPAPLLSRFAKDVSPEHPWPEYPRPTMQRERWLNLNGLWQFVEAKEGDAAPFGKELDARILVPFPVESALSGVGRQMERLFYRRTFDVPAEWGAFGGDGQRLLMHFGAVDWECEILVNGKSLLTHRGGYDRFSVDVTDALIAGATQELIVRVFDPSDGGSQPRGKQVKQPGGIWYTPTTGIWQTVWIEPVPKARIVGLKLTPDLAAGLVHADVRTDGAIRDGTKMVFIVRGAGVEPWAHVNPTDLPGGMRINVPAPRVWRPEDPYLYDLTVEWRRADDSVIDRVTSYFGMRSIALGKDEQGRPTICLNGKPIFQLGPLDQGFWPDGLYTPPTDEAMRSDLLFLKQLGMNCLRKHVKVESERYYAWCDRIGLLVWQDMPSMSGYIGPNDPDATLAPEATAQWEVELRAMMSTLHNHPSIVHWVVFNEGWGQHDTDARVKLAKELDPSRIITGASGWTDRQNSDVHDLHIYPEPHAFEATHGRAGVVGEFGGFGLRVEGHTWAKDDWGYRGTKSREELTDAIVESFRILHEARTTHGVCAGIYTQTSDVEVECNGFLTYDRAVVKVEVDRVRAAAQGRFPTYTTIVPCAETAAVRWRSTTTKPADGWERADFDDASWTESLGGFGTESTPGARVGTKWDGKAIWLRRRFDLERVPSGPVSLRVHHDEGARVFLNGVLAATLPGYATSYASVAISPEAAATLREQGNVLAIECLQEWGGQYIDAGLVTRVDDSTSFDEVAAARFAELALGCIHKEYPNKIAHTLESDADVKPPRDLTPMFYGCFDWHSSVHGHWLLVRLLKTFPRAAFAKEIRAALDQSFTEDRARAELAYLNAKGRDGFERPYGLAWLLQLCAELRTFDDADAKRWADVMEPLERAAAARFKQWLPKLTDPIRTGEHAQTAFAFGLALDWARTAGDRTLEEMLVASARDFHANEVEATLRFEPSGQDFLSPTLAVADLMRRVLAPVPFARWLADYLPEIPLDASTAWLEPAVVLDPSDGKLAHLDGLNLSRAWMLEGIASALPPNDSRVPSLLRAADRHRTAGLAAVTGEHYEGGHWLGSFAVYLTTKRGITER